MSFWRTFGFHTVSAIDTILDKEGYTLEELLDEEEILQEVKSQNKRLLDFLTQPDILKVLIEFITVEPPEGDEESKRKFKYPFLACEILCSDVWTICDAVYKDQDLVHSLYSFLEQDAPLNHQLANYVCRSAGVLLQRKITETVDYMKDRGMIQHFIKHLNNASVMDLLLKVIACEETSEGCGILDWLCETDLIPCLVSKFSPENTPEVHENAAQALVDIISVSGGVSSSPLIRQLESEPIVKSLFDAVLHEPASSSALLHGLTVAIELLARSAAESTAREEADMIHQTIQQSYHEADQAQEAENNQDGEEDKKDAKEEDEAKEATTEGETKEETKDVAAPAAQESSTADDNTPDGSGLSPLLAQTLSRLDAFAKLLTAKATNSRPMSSGETLESFGFEKLKILEFFAMVVRLDCEPIDAELMRLDFFTIAMEAFFKYTWNNFLHSTVEQIVAGVLEGDNSQLQLSLVNQAKLPSLLVNANKVNNEEIAKPRGVRRGYMGHVTSIAVRLMQTAARSAPLAAALESDKEWYEYLQGDLAAVRTAETKPLGGHRPMGGPGESSDEDEEELDDDGDSIFDRYQLGFGTEEFGDEDGDGDMHFDDDYDDGHGGFEMYEDGSDDSGEGDWAREEGSDGEADDVEAVVAEVEAAAVPEPQDEAEKPNDAEEGSNDDADNADNDETATAKEAGDAAEAETAEEETAAAPAAPAVAATQEDGTATTSTGNTADETDATTADKPDETDAATNDDDDDEAKEETKAEEAKAEEAQEEKGEEKEEEKEEGDDLMEAFKELDTDNSGKLSRSEIVKVMENMDQFDTPEKIDAALKDIDADGDGQIDYAEFVKLATSNAD